MASGRLGAVLRQIRQLVGPQPTGELTDGRLLERFTEQRDEAAFEALLQRHGPLVLGVCRRILPNAHDADDAFQATFLVLVRKAGSLSRRSSVAPWLYTVAYHTALRARAEAARRRQQEGRAASMPANEHLDEAVGRDLRSVLDEELGRLPEKYRAPVVLCYLEGKTNAEAAQLLGWSKGTVSGRLARARALLRQRLTRRGVTLSTGTLTAALAEDAAAAVPAVLLAATAQVAAALVAGKAAAGAASTHVAALAEGVLQGMFVTKLKLGAALVLALGALVSAVGLAAHQAQPANRMATQGEGATELAARDAGPPKPDEQKPARTDRYGDSLPAGVLARMGSGRLRQGDRIRGLVFSPDGKFLASAGCNGFRIWSAATGKLVRRFDLETDLTIVCDYSAAAITVAGFGQEKMAVSWRVIDPVTGEIRRLVEIKDPAALGLLAISPGGKQIAVPHNSPNGCHLRLYDSATGQEAVRIPVQDVRAAVFAPDGKTITVCDLNGTVVRIHDAANGRAVRVLRPEGERVNGLAFSPDGRFLALRCSVRTGRPGEVSIWDLSTGKERHRLKTDPGNVVGVAFSPDGRLVATAGHGENVILWDLASGKEVRRLPTHHFVSGVAFSPDGKVLATAEHAGVVSLWDVATGQRLPASAEPGARVYALRFASDGQRLTGINGGSFAAGGFPIVWDSATGREIRRFPDVRDFRTLRVLSPDESLIAAVGKEDGTIRLHHAATGEEVRTLKGHDKQVSPILFSADGRRLFSSSEDGTIRAWEVTTGRELLRLPTKVGHWSVLAASPDGRWFASLTWDSDPQGVDPVVVWDLTNGREAQRFTPRGSAPAFVFSPDSRLLAAVVNGDNRDDERSGLQVWDVATGREYTRFVGHEERVLCVAFSSDGRMLAAGGEDRAVHLWELASGRQRGQFHGHESSILSVAFSPDGRALAASSVDAPVYLWDVTGRMEQPRRLTPAELEQAWASLGSEDAPAAFRAMRRLAAAPEQAVPFLRQQVRPAIPANAKRLAWLIADLDREDFEARQRATAELERLGEQAEPALRKALTGQPAPEARRRLEQLVGKLSGSLASPVQLPALRAVEALEWISTPEARQLLEKLAEGAPEARLTQDAKAALERLARRPASRR